MKELSPEQITRLVKGFYEEVDGGYCTNCSSQAVGVLSRVFFNQADEIQLAFDKIVDEE